MRCGLDSICYSIYVRKMEWIIPHTIYTLWVLNWTIDMVKRLLLKKRVCDRWISTHSCVLRLCFLLKRMWHVAGDMFWTAIWAVTEQQCWQNARYSQHQSQSSTSFLLKYSTAFISLGIPPKDLTEHQYIGNMTADYCVILVVIL